MLRRVLVLFLGFLVSGDVLAQCLDPHFQFVQNPSCAMVGVQNQTMGSVSQVWDFSTGDLFLNPSYRAPVQFIQDPRGLNIVKEESTGNYYGFTLSGNNGLARLDFGNSLSNVPTVNVLGNFGLIAGTYSDIALAFDGTNWYGYLGNADNRVLIFNFGNSLANTPTVTNSPVLTGVTSSRNVDIFYFQGNWYLVIANSNNTFAIYQIGSTLSSSLTFVRTYTLSNTSALLNGIRVLVDCDTVRVLGCYHPVAHASFFKVDFPVDFSSPVEVVYPIASSSGPFRIDYGYDSGRPIVFFLYTGVYRRLVFENSTFNTLQTNTLMPNLTGLGYTLGLRLIKEQSTWYIFFVDASKDSLFKVVFPEPNPATPSYSTDYNPPTIEYTTNGTKVIDLMSFSNAQNFRFYSDSVSILAIPSANFSFSGACSGQAVQFVSNSSISLGGTIVQHEWDFGDGNTSNSQNPQHTYSTSGSFNVRLIVTSNQGCKDTIIQSVFYSPGPTADFSVNVGCQNSLTTFTNNSTSPAQDPIASYYWDFGDGNTSNLASPTHVYTTSGNFNVKLKVTTQNGCIDSTQQSISVPASPDADFSFSQVCLGSPTLFNDLSTGSIASVVWDMGDGNVFNTPVSSYTFATSGSFNVKLKVIGTNGCEDTITKVIQIVDVQSLSIQAPSDTCQYSTLNFQGSASVTGDVVYEWIWDFGNGDSAFVQNPTYAYSQSGSYTVKLTIRAGLDCYQTTQTTVQVNPAPLADFSVNTVCVGSPTSFVDNTSYPLGQSEVFRRWYFGNGDSSDVLSPVYTYSAPGTYNVTLVVESNTGCRNQVQKTVTVAPYPVANALVLVGCLGDSTHFIDQSTISPAVDSIVSWTWNIQGYGSFSSKNVSIFPTANGSISYELIVTNSTGCSDTLTGSVLIEGADFQLSPNPVCAFSPISLDNLSSGLTRYQWDFCLGDLRYVPTRLGDFPLLDARSISFVQDPSTQNWYAFVVNPDGLVRLDFGTSLENTPTYNVLGTFGITASMYSRVSVHWDGTKWFGYMGNASNRLITFDFGNALTNIPTSSTTAVLPGVTASRNVEVFNFGGNWYAVVINANATVSVLYIGSSLSSTLTHLQTYVSSNASAVFTDIRIIQRCNQAELLLMNYHASTSSINKLTFTQLTQPPIETVFPTNVNFNFVSMAIGYEKEEWNAFVFGTSGGYRRMVFDRFWVSQDTNYIVTNPNLKDIRGVELIKQNSRWYLFVIDRFSDSLVTYIFPDTCSANVAYSNDFEPTGLYYAQQGTHRIELRGWINHTPVYQTRSVQVSPSPVVQVNIQNLCEKSAVVFDNHTTYVDTSVTIQYTWDFGDGNTSTAVSPVHYYDTTGTYTVQLTASVPGLCATQESFVISIYPRPIADFQFSSSCANSPVHFTNLSTVHNDSITFYKWEFGDGTFSLDTNPSHQYLLGGLYEVRCIVITSNGCVDTAIQTIEVPRIHFQYENTCLGEMVQFTPDWYYPNDAVLSANWYINNQWVSNQPNFSYFFPNVGSYAVKLVVQTQNNCLDSTIRIVDIIQRPVADFEVVGSACAGDTILFVDQSTLSNRPIAMRIWDFGDGNVDTTTEEQVYHAFSAPNSYSVTLTIITTTNCTASVTLPVLVGTTPTVGFTKQNLFCASRTFTLVDTSSSNGLDSIVSRYWDLGDGFYSTNAVLEYQYSDTGQKVIRLTVVTRAGCSATLVDTLYLQAQPVADFSFTRDTFLTIEDVTVVPTSQNADSYLWLRSDSASWFSTDSVPVLRFTAPGTYTVTFIASNASGCSDTVQKSVVVVYPIDTVMDIAVFDLNTLLDSANVLTVSVKIRNKSTVALKKATMYVRLGQEVGNKEFYIGDLAPGAVEEYIFKARILTNPYESLTYLCVSGVLPNDLEDVHMEDNEVCKSLTDNFYIQNPYPNPTSHSLIVPYVLPAEDLVRIKIVNELGQLVTLLKEDFGNKGLNVIQVDVSSLSSGAYFIVIEFQGKFLIKKWVKY